MPKDQLEHEFADYLAGRLTPAEARDALARMSADDRAAAEVWTLLGRLPEMAPTATSRSRFMRMLREQERPRWMAPSIAWGAAAAVFFVLGLVVGRSPWEKAPVPEVATLREEVRDLREAMIVSMLQQRSATGRLQGVLQTSQLSRPDAEVLRALTDTLRRDPNVNVRLAAVDALKRFANEQTVRSALIESLRAADSPLVQVALIDALTDLEETAARAAFEEIEARQEIDRMVKQRARLALQALSQ